ncbi:MAG: heme-dependent oxidative N-demethylase family protein [Shimia sp.]
MPQKPILQRCLPYDTTARPLPGVTPLAMGDWLWADDAFGAQMAERARLLRAAPGDVLARVDGTAEAEAELRDLVLDHAPFLARTSEGVRRPDGVTVALGDDPLQDLGHLVQEDFVLLRKEGAEHILAAALLCFPANWTLAEKLGRPLVRIHRPVESYDGSVAKRVQRLFDGVKPGRPLWRFNHLRYADAALHQPEREGAGSHTDPNGGYIRSERQSILRLPRTGYVVFSIHTTVVRHRG